MKVNLKCQYLSWSLSLFLLLVVANTVAGGKLSALNKKTDMKLNSKMEVKLTTKLCNPMCQECSTNDRNYCTICQSGIIFYQFNCLSKCPEGTYMDEEWKECRRCAENCPVCWGSQSDMCGTTPGVKTTVVFLEKEIKDFLFSYTFTPKEIEDWIESLKVILERGSVDSLLNEIINFENLTTNEVYNTQNKEAELPLGSFSKFDGVFIPVPAYLNFKKELVESHWVYKQGMWDGKNWVEQFFPRLPTFIKYKGLKNKIYYENEGFWIWDQAKDWYWIKAKVINESQKSIQDELVWLNTIKIDLGDYNRRKWRENQEMKKLTIQNNIRGFFDKFLNTNRFIFTEMKKTMNEEQAHFVKSLEELKNQVHSYFGEENLESNSQKYKKFQKAESCQNNSEDSDKKFLMQQLLQKIESNPFNYITSSK